MDNKEVIVHLSRGHILQIGKKFFKLDREEKDEEGRTVKRQVYKEVNPDTYAEGLWNLARRLEEEDPVKLIDIIIDALKDLPLERLAKIENALLKARKPKVVSTGGCIELKIDNEYLVLRE